MKNIGLFTLLFIMVLCVGLMFGILIGRSGTSYTVKLSAYDQTVADRPAQTTPYISENIGKININLATADELSNLPGIGITYAERIVEHRTKYGPFLKIEDITQVKGIGDSRFEKCKEYITVGG